jgi:phosphoribosylaminoimidazolecarboxamide formyltransferase/IMP cyclohydrolase
MLPARRALVSVFDKRGLEGFARGLHRLGIQILSTGGTLKFLGEKGIPVTAVADVTGFPEILDGRVKTLHPRIHGGILARRSEPAHLSAIAEHGIERIDLVVVNLYPFRETVAKGASFEETVEMIDIGGPAMVRAAAKNFDGVAVVVDPADYDGILAGLELGGGILGEPALRRLAAKAFRHTHEYDGAIASWLEARLTPANAGTVENGVNGSDALFPRSRTVELRREAVLRYGENPHQQAALYAAVGREPAAVYAAAGDDGQTPGVFGGMEVLQGKELSWNNLLDADAARKMAALFAEPAVVIVKHNNPSGIGRAREADGAEGLVAAYERAFATDPVSAYGSVIAVNRAVDGALVEAMADLFVEVLLAPGFEPAAREKLAAKKSLRVVRCPLYAPRRTDVELRAIDGGFLAQNPDGFVDGTDWTCPTKRQPAPEERRALEFAWKVARYVKSNAIVITNGDQTVGVGAGQMSRVDSCRLAIEKARLPVAGCVAASDAFFPFRDGLDLLIQAGIKAIVQPGGSKRDDEVIAAADEAGVAMVLTGVRHFRH